MWFYCKYSIMDRYFSFILFHEINKSETIHDKDYVDQSENQIISLNFITFILCN